MISQIVKLKPQEHSNRGGRGVKSLPLRKKKKKIGTFFKRIEKILTVIGLEGGRVKALMTLQLRKDFFAASLTIDGNLHVVPGWREG